LARTEQITLPHSPGTYFFEVTTNVNHDVAEGASYGHNTTLAAAALTLSLPPLPDLVVSSISPPPNGVLSGNSVPVSFVITNQGSAPTTVPVWQDWVILSQDASLLTTYDGTDDKLLINQPLLVSADNPSYLDIGQSYQQPIDVQFLLSAQA